MSVYEVISASTNAQRLGVAAATVPRARISGIALLIGALPRCRSAERDRDFGLRIILPGMKLIPPREARDSAGRVVVTRACASSRDESAADEASSSRKTPRLHYSARKPPACTSVRARINIAGRKIETAAYVRSVPRHKVCRAPKGLARFSPSLPLHNKSPWAFPSVCPCVLPSRHSLSPAYPPRHTLSLSLSLCLFSASSVTALSSRVSKRKERRGTYPVGSGGQAPAA